MSTFEYVGILPKGDWKFLLVQIESGSDVIAVVESRGWYAPRMIIDGKLVNLEQRV